MRQLIELGEKNSENNQFPICGGFYFTLGEDEKLFTIKGEKIDGYFHAFMTVPWLFMPWIEWHFLMQTIGE